MTEPVLRNSLQHLGVAMYLNVRGFDRYIAITRTNRLATYAEALPHALGYFVGDDVFKIFDVDGNEGSYVYDVGYDLDAQPLLLRWLKEQNKENK